MGILQNATNRFCVAFYLCIYIFLDRGSRLTPSQKRRGQNALTRKAVCTSQRSVVSLHRKANTPEIITTQLRSFHYACHSRFSKPICTRGPLIRLDAKSRGHVCFFISGHRYANRSFLGAIGKPYRWCMAVATLRHLLLRTTCAGGKESDF
jgi:hypothetical protein